MFRRMCRSLLEPHATVLPVCPQPRYLALHVNCMLVLMVLVHDKRLGPGFHHLPKLIVVIVITLLNCTLSAPRPAADPWWYNPCTAKIPIRHGRSTSSAEQTVKNQLKIFIAQLREAMKNINQLYKITGRRAKATPTSKLPWLKMKKMVSNISKANSRSKNEAFKQFHESLQYFAGTLETLRHAKIDQTKDNTFNQDKRDGVFENITNQMKSLLCEVQYAIGSDDSLKKIPYHKMKVPDSLKKLDVTSAQIHDINFFSRTRSFFRRTQRILSSKRKLNKKTQKATSVTKRKTRT